MSWTAEEIDQLKELADKGYTARKAASLMNRTPGMISGKATRLGIRFGGARKDKATKEQKKPNLTNWTDKEKETFERLWKLGVSATQIAEQLPDRSRSAVLQQALRRQLDARKEPSLKKVELPELEAALVPVDLAATNRAFAEEGCQWIEGAVTSAEVEKCGKPLAKSYYCAEHGAIAYVSSERKRV